MPSKCNDKKFSRGINQVLQLCKSSSKYANSIQTLPSIQIVTLALRHQNTSRTKQLC